MERNPPSYAPWSLLHQELLEIILSRLDLADHIRFGAVCKRWRSIALENTAANKPFSLVRSANSRRLIYSLLSSFDSWQWVHARFIGWFKGWLVLRLSYKKILPEQVSLETRCILLNPGTRSAPILLPPLPSWSSGVQKVVLSSSPDDSSADKCTIVFRDTYGFLGFCRLGDNRWTRIYLRDSRYERVKDMLFYKGQLYVFYYNDGLLSVFYSGLNSTPTRCLTFPSYSPCYLMISPDKLLLLHIEYPPRTFEIDLRGIPTYIELESLGDDKILFLISRCSLCLPANEYPEFTPNRIYSPDGNGVYSADLKMFERINNERSPVFCQLFRDHGFKKTD